MSSITFELRTKDMSRYFGAYGQQIVNTAIDEGIHEVMDDWKRMSVDKAPLSKSGGTLRRSIHTEIIEEIRGDREGIITANATERWGSSRFNYAYWLHEVKKDIKSPTTPGTIGEFLTKPAEESEARWNTLFDLRFQEMLRELGG